MVEHGAAAMVAPDITVRAAVGNMQLAPTVAAAERTREELRDTIEGRLASSDERSALLRLATRLVVEEALKAEVEDALDRGYYAHGAAQGAGYRNGYRTGRLKTAEGANRVRGAANCRP
jgi:hypothetical protein